MAVRGSKGAVSSAQGTSSDQPETSASPAPGRELIDARGSIDSRTFNEEGRISSVAKDKRDRRNAAVESNLSKTRWHSRSGGVGFSGGVLSGGSDYGRPESRMPDVPTFFKVALPVIAVLIAVVIILAIS